MNENTLASKTAVNNQTRAGEKGARAISLERHRAQCTVCKHPACEDIESHFINWIPPASLAASCDVSYDALYRHAHTLDLFKKRQHNIRRLLEKGIDRLNLARLDNSQVISLINFYVKMNLAEHSFEKAQAANHTEAFEGESNEGREPADGDGSLPESNTVANDATPTDRHDGEKGDQVT